MKQHVSWIKTAIFGALAASLGMPGFSMLFAMDASAWERVVIWVVFFFLSSLMIGYAHPERWWIAGFAAFFGVWAATAALTHSLWVPPRVQNAPTLQISITEGKIVVSPSVLKRGDLRLEQSNSGTAAHEIGIFYVGDDDSLEQLLQGRFQRRDLRASLRPISPGGSDVSLFRNYFQVGRYAVCCLVEDHAARGEVATFRVEP